MECICGGRAITMDKHAHQGLEQGRRLCRPPRSRGALQRPALSDALLGFPREHSHGWSNRLNHPRARGTGARRRNLATSVPVRAGSDLHGGGWVLGNAGTHDRLVRELAVGARAAVAFVEYTPSPEAHYPVAIEQGYATAQRQGVGQQRAPGSPQAHRRPGLPLTSSLPVALVEGEGDHQGIHREVPGHVTPPCLQVPRLVTGVAPVR